MLKIKLFPYRFGLLEVKIFSADQDQFFEAVESLKDHLDTDERRFDKDLRSWIVEDCDSFEFWIEYARENLCADVEDSRNSRRRENYKPPQSAPKVDRLSKAFEVLHLRESAPLVLVRAARRALASEAHPDKGGSEDVMKQINHSADLLEKRLTGGSF